MDKASDKYERGVDTDMGDYVFHDSPTIRNQRNSIVKQSKLVQMVDELELWSDIGGSLEVNDV